MKTDTSSFDLYYIIKELQFVIDSKVDKLYEHEKNLLLQLHVPSKGRTLLNIVVPNYIYISSKKSEFPMIPKGFCMFLRKYLHNTRIREIKQVEFERIIEMTFEGKDAKYIMVIELFSKGNIILCKEDYTIMSAVENQRWSSRIVRGGVKYEFPKKNNNILTITKEDLKLILEKSDKESIVKLLAMELSLGGLYAEEVCALSNIDKDLKPKDINSEILYDGIKTLFNKDISAVHLDNEVFPIKLISHPIEGVNYETFSEAINNLVTPKMISKNSDEVVTKHEKKLGKAKNIINAQKKQIRTMDKLSLEYQQIGESIFENYQLIGDILKQINDAQKKIGYKEIKEKLKGHKIIKEINDKEHKITIEIENDSDKIQ